MNVQVPITCPGCKRSFKIALTQMDPGKKAKCPGCGAEIKFTGDSGSSVQRSLDNLEATIRRFGK